MKHSEPEFPLLEAAGLYAADIRGDGNCLFNALSDQMYGNQDHHAEIRARTIDYMREHAEYYKMFMEVYEGGGTRRNPKRKNAGGYASSSALRASPEELDRVFQQHIQRMAQGGAWGDNMEIVAFCNAFDINVRIYQTDFSYYVRTAKDFETKRTLHIAYHTWEHYSSIRNTAGPHSGLPDVNVGSLNSEVESKFKATLSNRSTTISPWQINIVAQSVPHPVDRATIIKFLEETKGNVNNAVDKILELDDMQSVSSHQSSSVEREVDSDDERHQGPNKKQNRRLSSAATLKTQQRRKNQIASKFDAFGDSLEDLEQSTNGSSSLPSAPSRQTSNLTADDTEEEDWSPGPLKDGDTSSGSEYSGSTATNLKVKLSQPNNMHNSTVKGQLKKGRPATKVRARDMKEEKKRQRKREAIERKRAQLAIANPKKHELEAPAMSRSNSNPTMTNAIRTLYI